MKAGRMVWGIFAVVVAIQIAAIWYVYHDTEQEKKRLDELRLEMSKTAGWEKAISESEKKLLDSINILKNELHEHKKEQARENTRLRRRNEDLARRFRDLDIDRPDF